MLQAFYLTAAVLLSAAAFQAARAVVKKAFATR
jgi:hypothetical protein